MKQRAKQLADEHWDYISSLLATHGTDDVTMEIIGFHYRSALSHGHGHGVEDQINRAKGISNAAFENAAPITAYTEAAAMDTSTGYLAFAANAPKVVAGMADCANFDASACLDCYLCETYTQITPPAREPWEKDTVPGVGTVAREPLDLRLPSYALPCTLAEIRDKFKEEVNEWASTPKNSMAELLEAWDCVQVGQTYKEHDGSTRYVCSDAAPFLEACQREGRPVMQAKRITLIKNAARGYYSPADCARILADV